MCFKHSVDMRENVKQKIDTDVLDSVGTYFARHCCIIARIVKVYLLYVLHDLLCFHTFESIYVFVSNENNILKHTTEPIEQRPDVCHKYKKEAMRAPFD